MRDTIGVLLAAEPEKALSADTRSRQTSRPLCGHYRIIDVTLSNCINSGLRKVLHHDQYKALSLNRHIPRRWTGIVARSWVNSSN